ncbi:MAG: hypothetical protein AAGH90_04735 [Pseudomonadota bacterium]
MSENSQNSGNSALYFIVGALVAGAAAFGIYYFTAGQGADQSADISISVSEDGVSVEGE